MTVSEPLVDLQFAGLLDVVPGAILCVDGDGAIVYANAAAAGLFGYERDALITLQLELLIPRSFRDLLSSPETAGGDPAIGRGEAAMQLVARRRDASEFAAEIMLTRTHMGGHSIIVVAPRDISERSRDAATFRGVLEVADDAAVAVDGAGRIALVNPEAEALFGYSSTELIDRSIDMLVLPPSQDVAEFSRISSDPGSGVRATRGGDTVGGAAKGRVGIPSRDLPVGARDERRPAGVSGDPRRE